MFRPSPARVKNPFDPRQKRTVPLQMMLLSCTALIVFAYIGAFYFFFSNSGKLETSVNGPVDSVVSGIEPQSGARDSKTRQPKALKVQDAIRDKPKSVNPAGVTIGFAVTVTGCGSDPITEGAAVLKHSIHLSSIHGNRGGRYDYKMYAIYHPDGTLCAEPLKDLGYELVMRETPVTVKDIKGDFLRKNIEKNGCCGEKELVKLEAYTFVDHPVVVHLDLDTLVIKPMDALFDWMLSETPSTHETSDVPIMWPEMSKPNKVNAFFTRDYNMAGPSRKYKPVQGGFLALRPDMNVYNEFVEIIKKGDFQQKGGWGGLVGPFYGSMTFQGIVPYYYDVLHQNEAVELSRCIYNQMADNPKDKRTVNDIPQGRCRTNQEECEDCRNRPFEDVVSAHFTLCQKPWLCLPQDRNVIQQRLCRKLHREWHQIRSDMEQSWGRNPIGEGTFQPDHFNGHCSHFGKKGYIPISTPYGAIGADS